MELSSATTIGLKQREAIFALKKGEFKNHTFFEYFNGIKKEFEEILKKLIPKVEKERATSGEYGPFKTISECQQTIQEVLKRFEYAGHERIDELERINDWVETYKKSKKAEEIQLKFPELRTYVKHKRSKRKKTNQPEAFIEGKTDTIIKELLSSVLKVKKSLTEDIQKTETNKDLMQEIICASRKAISALEYLKIIDAMQILAEVTREECSDKIKIEGAEQREEEERKECEEDISGNGGNEGNGGKNADNKANLMEDLSEIPEMDVPEGVTVGDTDD